MNKYEVVIAGGGLVGLTTAVALSSINAEAKIALVERTHLKNTTESALDVRSSALTAGSVACLTHWGVDVDACALTPITSIHVSASSHWGGNHFHANDVALPAFGYVVENDRLQKALLSCLKTRSNVTLFEGKTVTDVAQHVDHSVLTLSDEQTINAELLLICDGSNSNLAKKLGIQHESLNFHQRAIVCNVELSQSNEGIARELFNNNAPLAMLPLGDHRYAVVWCLGPNEAERVSQLSDDDFLAELSKATAGRISGMSAVGERVSFPLVASRAQEITRRRVGVIGNAAHTLHPVAGQGFNLCLRDIDALVTTFKGRADYGNFDDLLNWQSRVLPDQQLTWQACHSLVQAFSVGGRAAVAVRSWLMFILGVSPEIHGSFLARAADVSRVQL